MLALSSRSLADACSDIKKYPMLCRDACYLSGEVKAAVEEG